MDKRRSLYKRIYSYFDRFEDTIRGRLSHYPIAYALVAGICIVLFWRGIWNIGDWLESRGGIVGALFSAPGSVILTILVMLATGLFTSFFVGDLIIMSGLRKEKKITERTEEEIRAEDAKITALEKTLEEVRQEVRHLHQDHASGNLKPEDKQS